MSAPPPDELPARSPDAAIHPVARNWAMIAHLSAFVMFLSIPSLIGPLVVWLLKRNDHPFIEEAGKEALNFNISVTIYGLVAGVLAFVLIGLPLLVLIGVGWFVLVIVASVKTSAGESYRYPFTMRLIN